MKKPLLIATSLFALGACTTPISHLGLPSPSTISGTVESLEDDGFVLKDATGSIEVETEKCMSKHVSVGDKVTVKGVLDEDDSQGKDYVVAKEFDAFVVIKENGEEINLVPYMAKQK